MTKIALASLIFLFAAAVYFVGAWKNSKISQEERERLCKIGKLQDETEKALDNAKENLARARKILDEVGNTYAPVVHAHWEKSAYTTAGRCSHCGGISPDDYETAIVYEKYCPYCGAQMDEKEDEEEEDG